MQAFLRRICAWNGWTYEVKQPDVDLKSLAVGILFIRAILFYRIKRD